MSPSLRALVLAFAAASLLIARQAHAQLRVGTVDINRVFQSYGKTAEAEKKIAAAKEAATREFNDRADAYKKAIEEVNRLNEQIDDPASSAEAKAAKKVTREEKVAPIRKMEREITEFRQTREQQIQEQIRRSKEELVREITNVVLQIVKAKKMDLVFDRSGASFNGFSPVLFARESDDFTEEVIAALKKP